MADLLNFLTGIARPKSFRKLLVAPINIREGLHEESRRTIAAHSADNPSRIQLKMNALVDPVLIRALYDASRAGVKVELNIWGICCLRPQVLRVGDHPGRLLAGPLPGALARLPHRTRWRDVLLIGSADLMPRNLDHRVEALTPVEDPPLIAQVGDNCERCLAENTHAWTLNAEGEWLRRSREGDKR
ncbi:hypothetical protein [Melittangium boletus]|uniref:hypothetical protein n=1 Tax=Melittangium boletus TaxID=83453 RepID=UPI003CCBA8F5